MISLHAAISFRSYESDTIVTQSLIYQLIKSLASTMEAKWSRFRTRPAVGPYQCSADQPSRPALNEAEECDHWLIDCAEVTEYDWGHARGITDMCVMFAPFGCDDLFTQQWKGASARGQTGEVIERGRRLDAL